MVILEAVTRAAVAPAAQPNVIACAELGPAGKGLPVPASPLKMANKYATCVKLLPYKLQEYDRQDTLTILIDDRILMLSEFLWNLVAFHGDLVLGISS